MKTYKQMADNVLKRRDEYYEQKQDRKASRGVISAAVTACAVVVVILFGTIIGSTMKAPAAQETDAPPSASSPGSTEITAEETETKPEDTDDTEREATAEITEETAEEETQADEDSESESTMHSNTSTEEETPAENLSEETIPDNFTESDTVTERSDNTDSETEKTDTDNNGTEETEQYAVRRDNYYVIKNYQYDYDYSKTSTRMYLYDVMDDNIVYHDNITKADMLVKQHQDILEYKFEVYDDRSSNPGGVENWNDPDDKWVICFVADENIELISPACGYAFYDRGNDQRPDEDAWHQTIDLKFRFKDGKTNGTISIYAVVGEKSVQQFVEHKMEFNAEDGYWLQMHDYSFATVKGYDFRGGGYIDDLYHWAAVCFGDVDENGIPLYFSDPYMPDYYDCEACQRLRQEIEESEEFITEH